MGETRVQRHSGAVAASLTSHVGHAKADLDRQGLVSLDGVIPAVWLSDARTEVNAYLAHHGSAEHSLVDGEFWECPTIAALAEDRRVENFLHSLTSFPESAESEYAGYQQRVLRILDGSGVDSPPFDWHYDANAVAMLVPIVVPADGTGGVAIFADHRPHRPWATLSAAEHCLCTTRYTGDECAGVLRTSRLRSRSHSSPAMRTSSGDTGHFTPCCLGRKAVCG